MLCAVVPAQNEEKSIGVVLSNLLATPVDLIIPVINGCKDKTYIEVQNFKTPRILPIYFDSALGIDIPRAAGAKLAWELGAKAILFVDGDMMGHLTGYLAELLEAVTRQGVDMALTNCYPKKRYFQSSLAKEVLAYRKILNQQLGLFAQIKVSSPSHGPHAISRRLLDKMPYIELGIPPVSLALARKNKLNIKVASVIPHRKLGSSIKDNHHSRMVAETIIGDCIEAWQVFFNLPRDRTYLGREYTGYHKARRWDLLKV